MGSDRSHADGSGYLMTAPVTFSATWIAGIGVLTASARIAAGENDTIAVGQPLVAAGSADGTSAAGNRSGLARICRVFDEDGNLPWVKHLVPERQGQYHECLDMRRRPIRFGVPSCSGCISGTQ